MVVVLVTSRSASDRGGLSKGHTLPPYALLASHEESGGGVAATSLEALQARELAVINLWFAQQFIISKEVLHVPSHQLSPESHRVRASKASLKLQRSS